MTDGEGSQGGAKRQPAVTRLLLRGLRPYTTAVSEQATRLARRLDDLDRRLAEAVHASAQRSDETHARIDEVVSNLASTADAVRRAHALWSSPMYMADPDMFRLPASEGGGLGFRQSETEYDSDALYRAFEDVFRGPPDHVQQLQREYIAMLPPSGRVADVGCGRGEFLSLLAEAGRDRVGVDMNSDMASVAAEAGSCDVVVSDAATWLLEQQAGSLSAVIAAQVIEHMTAAEVERFLRAAHRALDPNGGLLIAETVNPYFVPAFRMFWVDLTHQCLIYPEVALTMAQATGFNAGDIYFPGGTGNAGSDRLAIGAYALLARRIRTEESKG